MNADMFSPALLDRIRLLAASLDSFQCMEFCDVIAQVVHETGAITQRVAIGAIDEWAQQEHQRRHTNENYPD